MLLASLFSSVQSSIPTPIKSVLNRLAEPVTLNPQQSFIWGLTPDELAQSFSFEIEKGNPNVEVLLPLQVALDGYISGENWLKVADLIEEYDLNRATLPSGMTLTRLLLDRAWDVELKRALPEYDQKSGRAVSPYVLPEAFIAPYLNAAQMHPDRVGLRCLAAWMHLKMAWLRRGSGTADTTSESAFEGCDFHVDAAMHLMKDIDAREANSPLCAETKYRCEAAGGALDLDELEHTHRQWIALNSTDMGAFSMHGVFVLPRWFGSYAILADRAKRACVAQGEQTGMATYAATYLGAIDLDQRAMVGLDVVRFKDGLVDMVSRAKDPAAALNGVCAHLAEICATAPQEQANRQDEKHIAGCKVAIKAILRKFIRDGMGTVTPALWTPHWDEFEVPFVLAEAFEAEIASGHTVHLDHAGATISKS